jgi:crotonobetainyl-CoA:carnitine CoA-transferase CaiB-like acyl-CoA transferase
MALAGPFGTLLLGGLGARVIKIENPLAGDTCRENAPYLGKQGATLTRRDPGDVSVSVSELNRLRNKQAITLNLKDPTSRAWKAIHPCAWAFHWPIRARLSSG